GSGRGVDGKAGRGAQVDYFGDGAAQRAAGRVSAHAPSCGPGCGWAPGCGGGCAQVDLLPAHGELDGLARGQPTVRRRDQDPLVRADLDDADAVGHPGQRPGDQVRGADEPGHEPGGRVLVDVPGRPELLD